eukprot:1183260-Prorocentrum_minimum.AAC.3
MFGEYLCKLEKLRKRRELTVYRCRHKDLTSELSGAVVWFTPTALCGVRAHVTVPAVMCEVRQSKRGAAVNCGHI